MTRFLVLAVAPALVLSALATPTAMADDPVDPPTAVVAVTPPTITGEARYREKLRVDPGTWSPEASTLSFQWLRDGVAVAGATRPSYKVRLVDIGTRISVAVTGSHPDLTPTTVTSAAAPRVKKAVFERLTRPKVLGTARFDRVVKARPADVRPAPDRVAYRWLRDGKPIAGAGKRSYRVGVADVGSAVSVEQITRREGFKALRPRSKKVQGKHRVDARRTVTYVVRTRGSVNADLATFKKLAQKTLDDPRGWRGAGVAFKRVKSGGSFTLWLSQASFLPSFGYPCSPMWSCRSGDNVIINQDRWQNASPMWNAIGRSLRDYRHMVVNHEVGHWLGHGHRYCGGPGKLAPLMMQQSKGLNGCKANPWPLPSERFTPRF